MWPKVIAQLIELLPHASRLMPMAEKFFNQKSTEDTAQQNALKAMAEGVRGDLGQVTAAHAGLYRQLQDQSAQIENVAIEVRAARAAADENTSSLAALDAQLKALRSLVLILSVVIILLVIGVVVLLVQQPGHSGSLL